MKFKKFFVLNLNKQEFYRIFGGFSLRKYKKLIIKLGKKFKQKVLKLFKNKKLKEMKSKN